jgi:hypothetical protein
MRTFPITALWFKLAKGTDLELYNWDEIAWVLVQHGHIVVSGPPDDTPWDEFSARYRLVFPSENNKRLSIKDEIMDLLRRELPIQFGERKLK